MIEVNDDHYIKTTKLHGCKEYYICVNSVEVYVKKEKNIPKFKETK